MIRLYHQYYDKRSVIMSKSIVYFSKNITPENMITMYDKLGISLPGKVAVKLHSGEEGNQNYLRPLFMKPMVEYVKGTVVECNTAYEGERNSTEKHRKLLDNHEWTRYFAVDLLDAEGPDACLPIPNGRILKQNYVGKDLLNYDSMLVLSHFKGHPMGGFGGALKQLSIGCASSVGKCLIHSGGVCDDQKTVWEHCAGMDEFCEAMADAAESVVEHFKNRIAFVSVMANLSIDCDCCAIAEDPCMADIGILSSLDPVALDRACMDLIMASDDPGRDHFMERVDSLHGQHTIEAAAALGFGTTAYELVKID